MRKIMIGAMGTLCLAAMGCIQTRMSTVIDKDGSGTFNFHYAVSTEVAQTLKELSEIDGAGAQGQEMPTLESFDQERLEKACQEYGVKLDRFSRGQADGRKTIDIVLAFPSVSALFNALAASGTLSSSSQQNSGVGLFRTKDGNYTLRQTTPEVADKEAEDAESESVTGTMEDMDPQAMARVAELSGKLMAHLSELDIGMQITVPGDVISHNAQRVEGRTLIWEVNSSNMMTAADGMEPEIVFSGKGLKIEAPVWEE
jgi:hypothetical protein